MDMAKVIAAGAANDGDLWEYIKGAPRANKGLRIGAIPTYPSGGSETSRGAVVDDQETGGNGTMVRALFLIFQSSIRNTRILSMQRILHTVL